MTRGISEHSRSHQAAHSVESEYIEIWQQRSVNLNEQRRTRLEGGVWRVRRPGFARPHDCQVWVTNAQKCHLADKLATTCFFLSPSTTSFSQNQLVFLSSHVLFRHSHSRSHCRSSHLRAIHRRRGHRSSLYTVRHRSRSVVVFRPQRSALSGLHW